MTISVKDSGGSNQTVKTLDDVVSDPLGLTADAASATGSISAKLRGIATALGITALDRGTGAAGAGTLRTTIDSAQLATLGQAAAAASTPVVQASDRQHTTIFSLTLSLDTSAYGSGDVLADTQQADAFFAKSDGAAVIQSVTIIDEDDQGVAFTIFFFQANRSLGTENSAPSISDANARDCLGWIDVATTDYKDLGGVKVAHLRNIGLPVKAVSGTDDLYVGVVNGTGTPTFTAAGIKLVFGVLHD